MRGNELLFLDGNSLENMRKFYLVYQDRISDNLYRNFAVEKSEKAYRILNEEKYPLYLFEQKLLKEKLQEEGEING